jgi:2-methylcitrate dehydratase PrpD
MPAGGWPQVAEHSLTEGLVALLARPITAEDRRRAALHLVDWIGCAAAGAASDVGQVFRAQAAEQPWGKARVVLGPRLGARDAAFANGAFGNVLEMDDVHREAILHPGPVVVPAALALAAQRDMPGPALLDALLRGYEAMIRIGRAMGPGHYARFHPTATTGPFGAAAACASLLGLDAERTGWALGNAGTLAGGLWQCRAEPVMTKQLHTARAAVAGLEAAELAVLGLTGPRFILEGRQGVFAGMAPDARPQRVLDEPDAPWLMHATSFKPWPACRHAHAAVDAALALRTRIGGREIAAVTVEAYADALAFCDKPAPRSTIEAKFSLQHAVAVTLVQGRPTLADFEPHSIARADLAALRARMTVREGDGFTRAYPMHFGSSVEVALADSTTLREAVPDALGDPENPLETDEILAKAAMLLQSAGVAQPGPVIAAALELAEGAPVSRLNDALP